MISPVPSKGGAGNVNALHDARLDGTRGLHELDLLGKHLGGVLGANGLHGIEDIKPGIDGILDSGHPRLGIELGDLSLTEAADMVDAVDACFLHALEVLARGVTHIAVDVGACRSRLANEPDNA